MLYFTKTKDGFKAHDKRPEGPYLIRWDFKTFEEADHVRKSLGDDYITTDKGPNMSPRYDVIRKPKVGEFVSYAFNGDAYPDSKIVSVSKNLRVVTTESGAKYYRHKQTGSWIREKVWFMVKGHHEHRNPHL